MAAMPHADVPQPNPNPTPPTPIRVAAVEDDDACRITLVAAALTSGFAPAQAVRVADETIRAMKEPAQ